MTLLQKFKMDVIDVGKILPQVKQILKFERIFERAYFSPRADYTHFVLLLT